MRCATTISATSGFTARARASASSTVRSDCVEELALGLYYSNETRWSDQLAHRCSACAPTASRSTSRATRRRTPARADDSLFSPKLKPDLFGRRTRTELYVSAGKGFHSNDARGTTITVDPATRRPGRARRPARGLRTQSKLGFRSVRRADASTFRPRCGCSSSTPSCCSSATPATPRRAGRACGYGLEVPLYYRPTDRDHVRLRARARRSRSSRTSTPPATRFPGSIDRVIAAGITFENRERLLWQRAVALLRRLGR